MKCTICGCTDENACSGGCSWISIKPPVCSACAALKRNEDWIKEELERLPFVNWDRLIHIGDMMRIFGWIDRPKDKYKDFILLEFSLSQRMIAFLGTSSAEKSEEIAHLLGSGHWKCKRVENLFKIKNCIELK